MEEEVEYAAFLRRFQFITFIAVPCRTRSVARMIKRGKETIWRILYSSTNERASNERRKEKRKKR